MSDEPTETWSILVEKDYLKFSAAHFLIFPDGEAERLHGHNYKVAVEVQTPLDAHGLVVNFKDIKPLVRSICDELDEHLLIPGAHSVLTAERDGEAIEIRYRERCYRIPAGEVIVLPINNTSSENLARWIGHEIVRRMEEQWPKLHIERLSVAVEETPGQRGIWTRLDSD